MHYNSTLLLRFCLQRNLPPLLLSPFLSILPNFSSIFSNIHFQTYYHFIQTKFSLCTFLVTGFSWTPLSLDSTLLLLSSVFLFSFLLIVLLLLLSPSQILSLSLLHSSNSLIPPKCLPLLYNPSISLNTLVSLFSFIYPKSSLLHTRFLLEKVGSSSVPLLAPNTSLSFSH